jgi:hypothetical protein
MSDDYPTDEELERLEKWPYQDAAGALEFAASLWHWPDWVTRDISAHEAAVLHANQEDRFMRFATGGWSGNESIIGALRDNHMVSALTWRLTARGGLHIYQLPRAAREGER